MKNLYLAIVMLCLAGNINADPVIQTKGQTCVGNTVTFYIESNRRLSNIFWHTNSGYLENIAQNHSHKNGIHTYSKMYKILEPGSYEVTYVGFKFGSSITNTYTFTVDTTGSIDAANSYISGPEQVELNQTYTYQFNPVSANNVNYFDWYVYKKKRVSLGIFNYTKYEWVFVGGGENRTSMQVIFRDSKPGERIKCIASDPCGHQAGVFKKSICFIPKSITEVEGPRIIPNGYTKTYKAIGGDYADHFKWNWDPGDNITMVSSSADKQEVTLKFQQEKNGISISVTPANTCGDGTTKTFTVDVKNEPITRVEGYKTGCQDYNLIYEVEGAENATSFSWPNLPAGVTATPLDGNGRVAELSFSPNIVPGVKTIEVVAAYVSGADDSYTFTIDVQKHEERQDSIFLSSNEIQNIGNSYMLRMNTCKERISDCPRETKKVNLFARFNAGEIYNWGAHLDTAYIEFDLRVESTTGSYVQTITLGLNAQKPEAVYHFSATANPHNLRNFTITPVSYSATPAEVLDSLQLNVYIKDYGETDLHNIQATGLSTSIVPGQWEQTFSWQPPSKCLFVPRYQVQYLRLFDINSQALAANSQWEGWKNAATFEVDDARTSVTLTLAEETGMYAWRVRPLGETKNGKTDPTNYGQWSQTAFFTFTQPDADKNFIYSRIFTEDGKQSERLTFANGLQQVIQEQTRLQTRRQVVLRENIYDYTGRQSLQVLPVPVPGKSNFGYEEDVFTTQTGTKYDASHFDSDIKLDTPEYGTLKGGYYSGQDNGINRGVPSSEDVPYTRTTFYQDGRIKETSGLGDTLSFQNGRHTTRYFYLDAPPAELTRLFGKETPDTTDVRKTIMIDPNNEVRITYKDKNGNVLVTCIDVPSGPSPQELLPGAGNLDTITDVRTQNASPSPFVFTTQKKLFFTPIDREVIIDYELTPNELTEICSGLCHTCDYKLTIELINEDDHTKQVIYEAVLPPLDCSSGNTFSFNTQDTVITALCKKETNYTLVKKLESLNRNPVSDDYYRETYAESIYDFYEQEITTALSPIEGFLETHDIEGLFAFLDLNADRIVQPTGNEDGYYVVYIACNDSIIIPMIDFCPPIICEPDSFENYFETYYQGTGYVGTTTDGKLKYLPRFAPGQFNTLIENMMNDGYDCELLWKSWNTAVRNHAEQINAMVQDSVSIPSTINVGDTDPMMDQTMVVGFEYSLFSSFIKSIENHMLSNDTFMLKTYHYGPSEAGNATVVEQAYKNFMYNPANARMKAVMDYYDSLYCTPGTHDFNCFDDSVKYEIYMAITGIDTEGDEPTLEDAEEDAENMKNFCYEMCEDREFDFFYGAVDDFFKQHSGALTIENYNVNYNDWTMEFVPEDSTGLHAGIADVKYCEMELIVQTMVEHCKEFCDLSVQDTMINGQQYVTSVGTKGQLDSIIKVFYDFEVLLNDLDGSCDDKYTSVDLIRGEGTGGFEWVKHVDETGMLFVADMKTWDDEFIYVLGNYMGTVSIQGHSASNSGMDFDFFVMKMDKYGDVIWLKSSDSPGNDEAKQMEVDSDGHIYITGSFDKELTFADTTLTETGITDDFTAKYDSAGNEQWIITSAPKPGMRYQAGDAIALADDGDLLVATGQNTTSGNHRHIEVMDKEGHAINNMNLSGILTHSIDKLIPTGSNILYCTNYEVGMISLQTGQQVWKKYYGGPGGGIISSITMDDNDGAVIVAGRFRDTIIGKDTIISQGDFDVFVERLDFSGNSLDIKSYGGSGHDLAMDIQYKEDNEILLTGDFSGQVQFTDSTISGAGGKEIFIAMLNNELDVEKVVTAGSRGDDDGRHIDVLGESVVISGTNETDALFGHITLNPAGTYVAKLGFLPDCPISHSLCFRFTEMREGVWVPDSLTQYIYNPVPLTCEEISAEKIYQEINIQKINLLEDIKTDQYINQYNAQCGLTRNLHDKLIVKYPLGYHNFTLYYYDRAGNLIRTVPPEGVDMSFFNLPVSVQERRLPDHKLITWYKYNSLGQVLSQHTPDGDTTMFIYDDMSRLRFSQNGNQYEEGTYSYTKYDNHGRIIEVGKSSQDLRHLQEHRNDQFFPAHGTEKVRTYYNIPGDEYVDGTMPRHLLNRVSYTISDQDGNLALKHDQVKTSYSYDPHGNVEWMVQNCPGIGKTYLRYEYDLISGNVTKVAFNEGLNSQFYHKYEYDADNRIRSVMTSRDNVVWENDASYDYYAHGPLKRTEIGHDKVQGLDYIYTIQGWLKGINHPSLNQANDPGHDGTHAAQDIFGMALNYYNGDYHRDATGSRYTKTDPHMLKADPGRSLYNGNISAWTSHTGSSVGNTYEQLTGHKYIYDALNRLVNADFRYHNGATWDDTPEYDTRYTYDGNGNILELHRNANIPNLVIDRMNYWYYPGTNRLMHIKDFAAQGNIGSDFVSQPNFNYLYDSIGNMIESKQDNIRVEWNLAGKVKAVHRTLSSGTMHIGYMYDANGNRIQKRVEQPGGDVEVTYYTRDAQGNIMGIFRRDARGLTLTERPIYGSDRLGVNNEIIDSPLSNTTETNYYNRTLGLKEYSVKDHLGNVRVLLSDEKNSTLSSTGHPEHFTSILTGYNEFYSFGMLMPGRNLNAGDYRFGFNGQEKLDEITGVTGSHLDFGARIYDSRVGRFLSLDPKARNYPFWSPYLFAANNPIRFIDVDGFGPGDGTLKVYMTTAKLKNGDVVYLAKRYYDNVTPEQVRAYERHAQTEGGWYEETKANYESYESNEDAWSWNVYGATTPEKRNVVYQGSNRGYIDVKENRGMLTGEIETEPDETIKVNVYVADKESGERQLIETFEFEEKGEFDIPYEITDDQYLSVEVSGGKVNSLSVGAYVPEKRGEDPQSNIDKYGEEEPTKEDLEEIENKTKHTKKR